METWKDVVGYEGLYQVSDLGRMKSLARLDISGRRLKERVMDPGLTSGYPMVALMKNGVKTMRYVHHMVLTAFVGPRPVGMITRHKLNNDRTDVRLVNLEYGTQAQNLEDRFRQGTASVGENHGQAKLTERKVRLVRALVDRGASKRRLARRYGVTVQTINAVVKRETWAHVI